MSNIYLLPTQLNFECGTAIVLHALTGQNINIPRCRAKSATSSTRSGRTTNRSINTDPDNTTPPSAA